ncbi:hypothetical protein [Vibrio owensii]|uniref:hypothetical protein n=1 Tax=Vibrio harveyi group TaxID=717610 RepID=UPI003CC51D8D
MSNTTDNQLFKKDILAKATKSHVFALEPEQSIALKAFKIHVEHYVSTASELTVEGLLGAITMDNMVKIAADSDNELSKHATIYLSSFGVTMDEIAMGMIDPILSRAHSTRMLPYIDAVWEDSFNL